MSFNALAVVTLVNVVVINLLITTALNSSNWFLALINIPVRLSFEAFLLVKSMLQYEFGTVEWKQRNICYTDLEVIPRLPKV